MASEFLIETKNNTIKASGRFGMQEIHPFLATCFNATFKQGYQDLIFDFSGMTVAFPAFMISLCSKVLSLRLDNIDVNLILPNDTKLNKLFINTNWAHIINPDKFDASTFTGSAHVPTIHFNNHNEQNDAVNKILDAILRSIRSINRRDLSAVEWSINEITDNVLVHAESKIGGLIQLSAFNNKQKRIEFVVSDSGVGIPQTLKPALNLQSDVAALDKSIQEGVTNGKGAGNGLFGSYQTCTKSGGYFHLHSGNASLCFSPNPKIGLRVKNESIPLNGTLLVGCLDYSVPGLLENALVFKGKKANGPDFIELLYEDPDSDCINFILTNESKAFGTRPAGVPVRIKLINLIRFHDYKYQVNIDFKDVPLLSSSFADEVFGKLYVEIGEKIYSSLIRFINCDHIIRVIIERSLNQRKQSLAITT